MTRPEAKPERKQGAYRIAARTRIVLALLGAGLLGLAPSLAELVDVYLKNGLRLRADVTLTPDEVIIRNLAGEARLPRSEVERIVPVGPAASQPGSQPLSSTPGIPPAGITESGGPEPAPAAELAPAPPLSDRDIQRLKLHELRLDGPPEPVQVRFLRKGRQRDLATEVLEQLRRRADFEPAWEEILTRGQPYEKLQLIVRLTGSDHADRIVIETDPVVFETFRRRVLPAVTRGCARSGCHGGRAARVFRFPLGLPTSDTYVYTTFVLLDQLETAYGPLLDRDSPEDSVLLHFMMPPESTDRGHPPTGRGPTFRPLVKDRADRLYTTVLNWINYLAAPRPDYGLEYHNPYAGRLLAPAPTASAPSNQHRAPPQARGVPGPSASRPADLGPQRPEVPARPPPDDVVPPTQAPDSTAAERPSDS